MLKRYAEKSVISKMKDVFVRELVSWARNEVTIQAIGVVGSHARGNAKPDSDIDLVILCNSPRLLIKDQNWISNFGVVDRLQEEDYGALTSLRVFYHKGPEVEFGIASGSWANLPIDSGTHGVVRGGLRILYDPEDLLKVLKDGVDENSSS